MFLFHKYLFNFIESSFEPPTSWEVMTGNLKVVTLKPSSQEYKDVETSFKASAGKNVIVSKVEIFISKWSIIPIINHIYNYNL